MFPLEPTAPLTGINHLLSQSSDRATATMNCTSSRHSILPSPTDTTVDAHTPAGVSKQSVESSQTAIDSGKVECNSPLMDASSRSVESTEFDLLLNDNVKTIRGVSEGKRPSEVVVPAGSGPRKSLTPNFCPSSSPKRSTDPRSLSRNFNRPLTNSSNHSTASTDPRSLPRDFNRPLSNSSNHSTASTDSSLIIEAQGQQFSGYGKPDTFLTPTGAGQRKSWKPKMSPKMSPNQDKVQRAPSLPLSARSDHSVTYQSKSPVLDGRTPTKDQGNRRMVIGTTFLSSVAPPWESDETRVGISDSKKDVSSTSSKRLSAPLSSRNPRAAISLSPVPCRRGTVSTLGKVTNPEALPPAFRAAFRSSSPAIEKMEQSSLPTQKKRWSYDPSTVERVNPAPKEKLMPSKLNYQWPPKKSAASKRLQSLSFLRVFDFMSDARSVKERRRAFEGDELRSSRTFPILVDQDVGLLPDQQPRDDEVDRYLPDGPSHAIETPHTGGGDSLNPDPLTSGSIQSDQNSTNCVELLSALKIQTSLKVRWGGPTYRMIDGRPLHYNGTYTDDNGEEVEFAPLLEDRFGVISRDKALLPPHRPRDSKDVGMSCPRRSHDDWSDDDSSFGADSQHDDEIFSPDEREMSMSMDVQPSVWLAPILPVNTVQSDENSNLWRMKRVWDDPVIDEKEPEHRVHAADVMLKVKELLGIPGENSNIADDYDPDASMWCIKKIYDIDGEIHEASQTVKVDERRLSMSFREVAAMSASINQLDGKGGLEAKGSDTSTDDDVEATTVASRKTESRPEHISSRSAITKSSHNNNKDKVGAISPRPKSERSSKKEQTIWDLLSPPSVSFVVESEN